MADSPSFASSCIPEVANSPRDVFAVRLQREVTGVEETNHRLRDIALERLGSGRKEERVVLAPHSQQRWLVRPEVFLERWVERDIALIVAEEVELHFIRAGTSQIKVVEVLTVRRHDRLIGNAVRVLPAGRLWREESAECVAV